MQNLWTLWMAEGKAELTPKGNFKCAPLPTVLSWVKKSLELIPASMIEKSFLKRCISNKMDGSEDDILWEDMDESDRESSVEDHTTKSCGMTTMPIIPRKNELNYLGDLMQSTYCHIFRSEYNHRHYQWKV